VVTDEVRRPTKVAPRQVDQACLASPTSRMIDQLPLLELSGLLFAGTAVAAGAPLVLSPSPRSTACISALSSGILVGAALFVVIPEGVDQVYRAAKGGKVVVGSTRTWVGIALLSGFLIMCGPFGDPR